MNHAGRNAPHDFDLKDFEDSKDLSPKKLKIS